MTKTQKAVIWGDSLARGVIYDEEHRRYRIAPKTAAAYVSEHTGVEIVNRARMGMTAAGGLFQMQADLAAGITGDVAFIEFGGNDSDFNWRAISENPSATHLPKTPIKEYEATVKSMIALANDRGRGASLY